MLLSMTGFGDAHERDERLSVGVEVRTVNNRYLKIAVRCPDAYAALETEIEKVVRQSVSRGTVAVSVRAVLIGPGAGCRLQRDVLQQYWQQVHDWSAESNLAAPSDVAPFLMLPGVVTEEGDELFDRQTDWPLIQQALTQALDKLLTFRGDEGRSMQQELESQCRSIGEQLDSVASLAPQVVQDYRDRMHERVQDLLNQHDVEINPSDLIRDVSLFADRCDINEEITRLRSHLNQFHKFLKAEQSQGRKLEFLGQEMFREVNTIGSKANNVAIAHAVVEMKSAVEKMREILQNVE